MLYRLLDLLDSKGQPDHGKVMGVLFFVIVVGLKLIDKEFTTGQLTVLASAVFGSRVFIAVLKGRTHANLGDDEQNGTGEELHDGRRTTPIGFSLPLAGDMGEEDDGDAEETPRYSPSGRPQSRPTRRVASQLWARCRCSLGWRP